jgi:hypothetical protein
LIRLGLNQLGNKMLFEEFTNPGSKLNVGDPVIITGPVEFQGKTGDVKSIGQDGAFVVVDLYNYGPQSFQASDVSRNDYADSQDEQDVTEVSKSTLDQYLTKAVDAHGHADFAARMSKHDPDKRSYHVDQKKTAEKRRQGISRALDRMSRPDDVAEGSLEEINFQNRSTSNSGTGELRGVNIPSTMKHPGWKEPTWSFQEIAQKLGISTSALNLLAFKSIGGFPEAVPGLAARYGSKKYYKQSEVKRWVNANNVREKLKQGVSEQERVGNMDADKFDDAMARLKQLAGAGPLKTVYDPAKRVYRNVPTAVQPQTQPKK